MPSKVQICNRALVNFGSITIMSIEDATAEARACKVLWDIIVDELLCLSPWNFAMKRVDLGSPLAETPAFEFDYQYTLPIDCLRVWELYGSEAIWVIEGGKLLTNDESAQIRYIGKVENPVLFSPAFTTCVVTKLAAELAVKLAADKNMKAALLQELIKVWLPKAQQLDAFEGNPRLTKGEQALDKGNFSWQRKGR